MSIEFCAVEHGSLFDQTHFVQDKLNDGWQIVSNHVWQDRDGFSIYTTFMQRDTTPKLNGLHTASVVELLEKRVKSLEDRTDVLEQTADMDDEQPADRVKVFDVHGTLIDLINPHTSQYIPLGSIYDEVIYSAIADEENEDAK